MKAAVYYGRKDLRLEEIQEPKTHDETVKIRVHWCGICGSDLHEYLAGPISTPLPGNPHPLSKDSIPVILGHEFSGEVVEVGNGVEGISTGDRVAIEPVYRCGKCSACRRGEYNLCKYLGFFGISGGGGGFAEYAVVPAYMTHRLPDDLTTEQGALVEPISVGLHAVRRSGITKGRRAVVFGAGPIGMIVIQCLKATGASLVAVTEVAEMRKQKALTLGADVIIDPTQEDVIQRISELTDGDGAEVTFDAAGVQETLHGAMRCVRNGGTVVNIALWESSVQIYPNDIVVKELNVLGSSCYTNRDFSSAITLLREGHIKADELVSARIPLNEVISRGFEELVTHKDRYAKLLVHT